MPSSEFTQRLDKYDLVFDHDRADAFGVMLARDKDAAVWSGDHQPALANEQFRHKPVSYRWINGGQGASYSKRTQESTSGTIAESTTTTLGGALTSTAYSYGTWITSKVPGVIMPSGKITELDFSSAISSGTIADGISYGGDFYISSSGRYLGKIKNEDATGHPPISIVDMGATFTSVGLCVFKGYLWITGQGSGTIRRFNGTNVVNGGVLTERSRLATVYWTISPQIASGGAANTGGLGAWRMIGTDAGGSKFQHISEADDPLDDNDWSGLIKIGDGASYTTQWITANNHTVWFATTGGLYACDETGYTPNLTEWVKLSYNPSNGGAATYWSGLVWYAHSQGLMAVPVTGERQDIPTYAQFGYLVPNQTPIWGRPRAISPDVDGLWVGYFNTATNTSYIVQMLIDKKGNITWSGPEAVFVGETVTLLRRVSPIGSTPYLLIATQVAGGNSPPKVYMQSLPVSGNAYTDWLNGTGHRFATAGSIYLPREDLDSTSKKVVERYMVVSKNLGNGRTIAINASIDDAGYVEQGVANRSSQSSFVAIASTKSGVNWDWRLDLVGTETQPPILEAFGAGVAIVPAYQTTRTYKVIIAPGQGTRHGMDQREVNAIWKRLEGLQKRDRITLRDQFQQIIHGRVEQSIPHEAVWDSRQECWVLVASVVFRVIVDVARANRGYCVSVGHVVGAS